MFITESVDIEKVLQVRSQGGRGGGGGGGPTRGGREGSKLGNLERTYFLNVPLVNYNPMTKNTH